MEYEIVHNELDKRFEAELNNQTLGVVDYYKEENNLVVTHTGVIREYEGRGIAAALTKDVLEYARREGFHIRALCSYTRSYIERHPEYQNLLIEKELLE